jgi:hypothetical protein
MASRATAIYGATMTGMGTPRSAESTDRATAAGEVPTVGGSDLPFDLETPLELRIAADPAWRPGIEWGEPRDGHPEGAVKWHVGEVLANLAVVDLPAPDRARLRIAALVHDTFKYRVDRSAPRIPPNEHGFLASRFLAAHVVDDRLVALVELHDDGYRAWRLAHERRMPEAWAKVDEIIRRLGDDIGLFVAFYWADNRSGDKEPGQVEWFVARLAERGVSTRVPIGRSG